MSSGSPAPNNQAESGTDRRQDEAGRAKTGQEEQESSRRIRKGGRRVPLLVGVALGLGATASVLYSVSLSSALRVAASGLMFAIAALAAGGLLGLLFGVPRTLDRDTPSADKAEVPRFLAGVGANTNLEQISDWLTKIIVGVTLTQLGTIREGAARLFNSMAPSLGGGPSAAAFAGGIVVYFSVFGFISGWLLARLRLGSAMSHADALLYLAKRAEQSGDIQTADVARQAARSSVK